MAWYTAHDIKTLREDTKRPMKVIISALNQVNSVEDARPIIMTHAINTCRCGIPIDQPHP